MNDIINRLQHLQTEIQNLIPHLHLSEKKQRSLELSDQMQSPNFWQDNLEAQKISQIFSNLQTFVQFWEKIQVDVNETLGLAQANTEETPENLTFFKKQVLELEKTYLKNRTLSLLSKKYDDHDAIFSLHAGAGGTDAQDWVEMLLRMYLRYAESKSFKTEILDISKGADAGIKSVTVRVTGSYAFGYFKSEAGVHRLVRLSPYNPAHTRETSFALLEVLPVLDTKEETKLDPKDLKIEANTSSGHGGQSVNTTYSAIRITHIPTGLKVSIQNERSQAQNKELAMQILQSKLKTLEEARQEEEKKELRGEFKSAEWGNQIRSYVLHPYQLVKDHRTKWETSNVQDVLNGDLDIFIEKSLEQQIAK